jgi:hypothetical protein
MKDLNIDLGSKMDTPCCVPEQSTKGSPTVYYPSFSYDGDEPMDFPDEGVMLVKYKKVSSTKTTRDDKTRYSCTIEVQKIAGVASKKDPDAPARNLSSESGDALDKLMAEKMKAKSDDAGEKEEY